MKGEDVLSIATDHIGEKYILGARAVFSNPRHKGPWDCAEFTSWCTYQTYKMVFGAYGRDPDSADAYSGKWYEDAKAKGTVLSVKDALSTPGAFLIRKPKYRGIRIGHVAISDGHGGTLEARGSASGVGEFEGAARRVWTIGCSLPGVDYSLGELIEPDPDSRVLKVVWPYMTGEPVRRVQEKLKSLGFDPGDVDGVYGLLTENAVLNFQRVKELVYDGEVGPETAGALGLNWPID